MVFKKYDVKFIDDEVICDYGSYCGFINEVVMMYV